MFSFKKEIDIGHTLGFVAIIISVVSLWQSNKGSDGYIIQGSGVAGTGTILADECLFVMTLPMEFNNSGRRSVALERFVAINKSPLLFTNSSGTDSSTAIPYEVYLSDANYMGNMKFFIDQVREDPIFNPNDGASFDQLIYPDKSYRKNIVVIARPYKNGKNLADTLLVSFDVKFSNTQNEEVRAAIRISKYDNTDCSKK